MHNLVNVDLIDKRRTSRLLTMVHSGVINTKFVMLNHDIHTRHNDGLKIELIRPRNEHVTKSFYMGTSHYNNLSLDMWELDLKTFKTKLKEKINAGEISIFCPVW